jgi:hypothetical protein
MRHARPSALPALALSACLAACAPAPGRPPRETDRAPVAVTAEGQRAYDDLAAWYRDPARVAPFEAALRDLHDAAPARRESAGRYLLDLLHQAFEDERNGRPDWTWAHPEARASWRSQARAVRGLLAGPFGRTADGEAALPAALWLVEEEDPTLPGNLDAGLQVLRRVRSDRSVEIFRRLLAQPHPSAAVARGILEEAAARRMSDLAPDVRRLCGHYRASVREAARTAAAALDVADLPGDRPGTAFTPGLEAQLRRIVDMATLSLPVSLPADAAPGQAPSALIDRLAADLRRRLLEEPDTGGEPGAPCGREIFAAALPRAGDDRDDAAARLVPLLDARPDDRLLVSEAGARAGRVLYAALLRALADERNLPTALILAHHFAKPLFEGCAAQADARLLAEQLPHRLDDFKPSGLRLPDPEAWERLKPGLDRPRHIVYLVERLRLLNRTTAAAATADPASFDDAQFAVPEATRRPTARGEPRPVINPHQELAALRLTVADIPLLAPHLAREELLPWAPPPAGPARLPRVNELVARLVNAAAGRLLVDPAVFFDLADDDRLAQIDRIGLWAEASAGRPRAELSREAAEEARGWEAFRFAVRALAEADPASARSVLERRAGDFADRKGDVEALGRELGAR